MNLHSNSHRPGPPTLDEIEALIRPILDANKEAIDRVLATGGIALVVGPDLHWGMHEHLVALGWDGARPVFRMSQAFAMRLADAQLLGERLTGHPPDPIYVRWLRDRRARRVWVHLDAANYICRAEGARITLVPGSTDFERAERGLDPVYVVGDDTNSPGGDA